MITSIVFSKNRACQLDLLLSSIEKNFLDDSEPPQLNHKDNVVGTNTFRAHRGADYSHQDRQNRALGLKGELLVLKYEKERLIDLGRPDLADKVIHASKTIGDGCGYDILSFVSSRQP